MRIGSSCATDQPGAESDAVGAVLGLKHDADTRIAFPALLACSGNESLAAGLVNLRCATGATYATPPFAPTGSKSTRPHAAAASAQATAATRTLAARERREQIDLVAVDEHALGVLDERTALAVEHHRVDEVGRVVECVAQRDVGGIGRLDEPAERRADGQAQMLVDVLPVVADAAADQDVNADGLAAQLVEDSHATPPRNRRAARACPARRRAPSTRVRSSCSTA